MGFEITDGTGKGNSVGVTSNNRILTSTISENQFQYAAEEGDAYFFGTPIITVTNASTENSLVIVTNNEDEPLIIGNFFFIAEETDTGSPNMFRVSWYKNPTSITSGTAFSPLNQNFGSSKTIDVTAEYGAASNGIPTGGGLVATLSFPIGQFNDFDANLVLEKGSSFALTVTAPAGNIGMPVQVGFRTIKYEEI